MVSRTRLNVTLYVHFLSSVSMHLICFVTVWEEAAHSSFSVEEQAIWRGLFLI